jgi:hypothetical protein
VLFWLRKGVKGTEIDVEILYEAAKIKGEVFNL